MPKINITTCSDRFLVAKTCRTCRELKMGSEYAQRIEHRTGRMIYNSSCKTCAGLIANKSMRRANDESLEKATQHREFWSKDEYATMVRLTNLGLSTRDVAERLGRTVAAVTNKLYLYRLAQELETGVRLCYYDNRTDSVRQVGKAFALSRKGAEGRLNKAAQELSELHTQLIFFITVDEGGEYMGIRGLDSLIEGRDPEPDEPIPKEETPQDD